MTQEMRGAQAQTGRRALTALVLAGVVGLSGCSSVPDALNPVEWYRGASDTMGGWFGDEEPGAQQTAGDPGSSAKADYPNLATVPARPTPSTTPAEREALQQGLVADRANARYTNQPAPQQGGSTAGSTAAPAPPAPSTVPSAPPAAAQPSSPAPAPAQQQASAPPAEAAATAGRLASSSEDRSALWPNRPPPQTPGLRPSTTGRVGASTVHRSAGDPRPEPTAPSTPPRAEPAPSTRAQSQAAAAGQPTERTVLDSAGSWVQVPEGAKEPARSKVPTPASAPTASSQSVIVNEDAIGGGYAPSSPGFSGQPYLASTIYFGHGSANLSESERRDLAEVAQTAMASGAAIQVVGHASARTAELGLRDHELANFAISLRRAQAVADALIGAGVPADRVWVEALSDTQPEFYEVMPSGEAGNRRVEVVLIY